MTRFSTANGATGCWRGKSGSEQFFYSLRVHSFLCRFLAVGRTSSLPWHKLLQSQVCPSLLQWWGRSNSQLYWFPAEGMTWSDWRRSIASKTSWCTHQFWTWSAVCLFWFVCREVCNWRWSDWVLCVWSCTDLANFKSLCALCFGLIDVTEVRLPEFEGVA